MPLSPTPTLLLPPASPDLLALPESQRAMELGWAGLSNVAVEGVALFLSALPRLSVSASLEVDGEGAQEEGQGRGQ
jgi:hypothetical protein